MKSGPLMVKEMYYSPPNTTRAYMNKARFTLGGNTDNSKNSPTLPVDNFWVGLVLIWRVDKCGV